MTTAYAVTTPVFDTVSCFALLGMIALIIIYRLIERK